jgi:2-C-methyl-D-erythritol 4-phosphate cytidylyltransferase
MTALVLAGGKGTRMGSTPKPFLFLGKKTIIEYSLEHFQKSDGIDRIVVIAPSGRLDGAKEVCSAYSKADPPILGGETRQDSVFRGLTYLQDGSPDWVLIHDAARPFFCSVLSRISRLIQEGRIDGIIPAYPVTDTIYKKEPSGRISLIIRDQLLSAQTPQAFLYSKIWRAHKWAYQNNHSFFSDDCSLLLAFEPNSQLALVEGDRFNIKITFPEDLEIANAYLAITEKRRKIRG